MLGLRIVTDEDCTNARQKHGARDHDEAPCEAAGRPLETANHEGPSESASIADGIDQSFATRSRGAAQ
jgi:hypothetical protein